MILGRRGADVSTLSQRLEMVNTFYKRRSMNVGQSRRYTAFITAAIFTFTLGIVVSFITRPSAWRAPDIPPISQSLDDEWHRLFEAAYMAQDNELRDVILGRLQCMEHDHSLKGVLVFGDDRLYCVEGTAVWMPDPGYRSRINAHRDWSKRNMPFIRSIANPFVARRYIQQRLSAEVVTSPS
jgi:hypothetical protein